MNRKPIGTALLSYGMSGRYFHAPFIRVLEGFSLVGCLQRKPGFFMSDFPQAKSYATLEEVLNDPEIELVVVNTPNNTHFEFTAQALMAKKHVLVEKPMAIDAQEAVALKELANKNNRLLTVYHNRRWDGDFITVKERLESGLLGKLIVAEFHADRFRPELSTKAHKETAQPGSGLLLDWGPHLVDQSLQLFGMPEKVSAYLALTRPGSVVDDLFDITLFYQGFTVRLRSGFYVMYSPASYILHGTKGSYIQGRSNIQEQQLLKGKNPLDKDFGLDNLSGMLQYEDKEGNRHQSEIPLSSGNYIEFYNRLFGAIREKGSLPVNTEEAISVMKILDAAAESNRTGSIIPLS